MKQTETTESTSTEVKKRGRKISATSMRQQRLARFAEKRANGEKVSRGRPKKSKPE